MSNNWIKQWTVEIRNRCDLIDQKISREDSDADKQLAYVMYVLSKLESRLHSVYVKPGRSKSYKHEVRGTLQKLKYLKEDVEEWQKFGIKPDYLDQILGDEK